MPLNPLKLKEHAQGRSSSVYLGFWSNNLFLFKISVTFLRLCIMVPALEIAAVLVWSGKLLLVFSWLRSCFGVVTSLTIPF